MHLLASMDLSRTSYPSHTVNILPLALLPMSLEKVDVKEHGKMQQYQKRFSRHTRFEGRDWGTCKRTLTEIGCSVPSEVMKRAVNCWFSKHDYKRLSNMPQRSEEASDDISY